MLARLVIFTLLVVLFSATASQAQQEPIGTMYMYNPLSFNPSYAGINRVTNVTLQSRYQWTSLEGSPNSYSLTANTSVVDGKVGLGLFLLNDQLGIDNRTDIALSYAYNIGVTDRKFSFGLQTGVSLFKRDTEMLNLRVGDDPFFIPGQQNSTLFNIGAGISYTADNFFFSFSVPKLFETPLGDNTNVVISSQHFYLSGSYLFDLTLGFKLKPSILLRGVPGAPLAYDINVTGLIGDHFRGGIFTRSFRSAGVILQFEFLTAYRLGYSFEFLKNSYSNNMLPTHEIMLSADFSIFEHQAVYQRYF